MLKPHWVRPDRAAVKAFVYGVLFGEMRLAVRYHHRHRRVCMTPILTMPQAAGHD